MSDEVVNTLQIQDVEAEQRKYNNFWVGIQRRIAMKKANVRADDSHLNMERANKTVGATILFVNLFAVILTPAFSSVNILAENLKIHHPSVEQ